MLTAAHTLASALPDLFQQISMEVYGVIQVVQAGKDRAGEPDATAVGAEELLRDWFHWWRTSQSPVEQMPDSLHVATVAYLAANAVSRGTTLRTPADV